MSNCKELMQILILVVILGTVYAIAIGIMSYGMAGVTMMYCFIAYLLQRFTL